MTTLSVVLAHISQGSTYSWDLTVLLSLGVPISNQLRERLLLGSTTQADAEQVLVSMQQVQFGCAMAHVH
jgi:hypothetical protein